MAGTTYTWTGVSGASWATGSNWNNNSPPGPPGSDDFVLLSRELTAQTYIAAANTAIAKITATDTTPNNVWAIDNGSGSTSATTWTLPSSGAIVDVYASTPWTIGTDALAGALILRNNIAGTGNLTKVGNRGLIFNLPSTRTYGNLLINEGNVNFGGGIAGTSYALAGGDVYLAAGTALGFYTGGGGNISDNIFLSGDATLFFGSGTTHTNAMRFSGTVDVGAYTLSLYTWGGTDRGVNGDITGTGVVQNTAGTTNLNRATYSFTGVVRATAGTLTIGAANGLQDATYQPGAGGALTLPATARIGGLTGSGTYTTVANLTLGGVNVTKNDTFQGQLSPGGTQNLVMNSTTGLSKQTWSSTSSVRNSASTTITSGVFEVTTTAALYTSGATGTTTVNSGGGLWLSGGITPNFGNININGNGATLLGDGAIRNVSGNNTLNSTVSAVSSAIIYSAADILTLGPISVGSASTLTFTTSGTGGITLKTAMTAGIGTSKVVVSSGSTVKAGAGNTGALAAVTNQIDGTFDVNAVGQTIASGKTLLVNGTWAGGTTATTIAGTLDGTGSVTGSGTVSISSGGALNAGSGAANATLSIAGGLTFAAGSQSMTLPGGTGTTLSKVAVAGALTLDGTVTVNASSATGWTPGTYTFLTYGSKSGAGAFIAGTLTGGTGRQSIGNLQYATSPATFDIISSNTSLTWAGGDTGGTWYDGQTTGWSGGDVGFINGDTVSFTSNTTTATLTSDVTVAAMSMSGANHEIVGGGTYTLTNSGALSISGAFTQTLSTPGEHGAVSVAAGSTLALNDSAALGPGTDTITLTGSAARLTFKFDANGLSTNRPIALAPGGAVTSFLTTSDSPNVAVTLGGNITGGQSTAALTKTGSGLVSLTGTNTYASFTRVGYNTAETAGENVLRVTPSALAATHLRLNAGSILEIDNGSSNYNFTRTYASSGATSYQVENLVAGSGGGFSSRGTGGVTVTQNITFGTSATTQWVGPMYFGTALGTSQGRVTMSGVLNVTNLANSVTPLDVYVFAGNGDGEKATISNLVSTSTVSRPLIRKYQNGALYVQDGSPVDVNTKASINIYAGIIDVGTNTQNIIEQIVTTSAGVVIRKEATQTSVYSPVLGFNGNATIESAGTGTLFVAYASNISSYTVTLSGAANGVWSASSGTGTGGYIKTGTGTWELAYAYASLAAGFTGGVAVQQGRMKASKKFALGGGPITMTGGELQFTDTTTTPAIIGSIKSLSTAGATVKPRIILGA